MYDEFFRKAHELKALGQPFATAIVVRAENPTSGKPGDKAIVTADGGMIGWIGGSCAQPTVIREAQRAIAEDRGRLIRLSQAPSEPPVSGIEEFPMTCFSGGTLDIYIEPQPPQPRLMVVGNLPVARALARLGKVMSYRVIAVDVAAEGIALPEADETLTKMSDLEERPDRFTAVVVATHGNYDDLALEKALKSEASYVALVASPKRAGAIREYLARRGFEASDLERLHSPAGLDIGARGGDEIALSILAEIIQLRRRQVDEAATVAAAEGTSPGHE
jgi:xanthine dehydrogenase accessory factor